MRMRDVLRVFAFAVCFIFVFSVVAEVAQAKTKGEINASVKAAMTRFKKNVKGANEFLKVAKGVLVLPSVTKAGFVVGGQYGQGALLVGGKTVDYYSLAAGSVGWQVGAQQTDIIIIFTTADALKSFHSGEGWEAGADAEVTMITVGLDVPISTLVSQHPVLGFVTNQKGLMAGASVKGAKFTKIHPD